MKKSRIYLWIQAALVATIVIMLSVSAIRIYSEGSERKKENALEQIYSRDIAAEAVAPVIPLAAVSLCMTAGGLLLGIRDENEKKPVKSVKNTPVKADDAKKVRTVRIVILSAAGVLIILGLFNGSANDVLVKAINICTECIGLG